MRTIHILLIILLATTFAYAQDTRTNMPDLQMANTEFFDPTRKNANKEQYQFSAPWRVEAGYVQLNQKQDTSSMYLHGIRIGATVDFNLPKNFSIQTGALATFTYGRNNQHWATTNAESAQINLLQHNLLQLQLTIPVRAYYNITLWKKLRMFFYTGPQLQIGLTNYDIIQNKTSELTTQWLEAQGIRTSNYERYAANELYRTNIQWGVGGGFEWDKYRLQAGYDFGLNNILKTAVLPKQTVHEWGWMVTFVYTL